MRKHGAASVKCYLEKDLQNLTKALLNDNLAPLKSFKLDLS